MKLNLKWGFTPRNSPEDDNPILPKFMNYQERLNSFHVLRSWEGFDEEQAQWLSRLGFYFSFSVNNEYVVLCFDCGCSTTPIFLKEMAAVDKDLKEVPIVFYHHMHCEFVRKISDEKWVADSKELAEVDDMPFEEYEKKVREFAKKRRAEVKLTKANEMQKLHDEAKQDSAGKTIPLCKGCGERQSEVEFFPCLHDKSCISWAKTKATCSTCELPYSGLARKYFDNYSHMTVPVVNLCDLD